MTLRSPYTIAGVLAVSAALAVPATAPGATPSSVTGGTSAGGATPAATPAPVPPAASGPDAITLSAAGAAFVGAPLTLRGGVPRRFAGRTIVIQLAGRGSGWSTVASAPADRNGAFRVRWRSLRSGRFTLRALVDRVTRRTGSRGPASEVMRVTIYPSARATWYGPRSSGVWRTACGTSLTSTTMGVAHRGLPCGSRVEVFYRGRSLVVPVIDRGPFVSGVDWDLTLAAADALGFTAAGVDRIGAMPLR